MSGYWGLNVEIDRFSGVFTAHIDYYVDPYTDPETSEYFSDTSWGITYSRAGGGPTIGIFGGYGSESGTADADLGLETGPGLKAYVLHFEASNTFSAQGISADWNVFSTAYDTTPQSIAGTAVNDIIIGGDGSDVLRGFDGVDVVDAGGGNDIVDGGSGNDRLDGGAGNDILIGGAGDDLVTVDSANDIVVERAGEGYDQVLALASIALAANVEELILGGLTGLSGTGNAANNRIFGNEGANALTGLGGNDILIGGNGDDVLRGGAGADQLSGGFEGTALGDTATYTDSTVGVVANLTTGLGSGGDAQGDHYIDIENLHGSQSADTLTGSTVANRLNGWAGKDVLVGLGGADRFVLSDASHSAATTAGRDVIADFHHAEGDRIDLSAMDANTGVAGNQAFSFIGTAAFSAAGQVRFFVSGSAVIVEGSTDADSTPEFQIVVNATSSLVAGDFIL